MGAKNSILKVLNPPKSKDDYQRMFPLDKNFVIYETAASEFETITGGKRRKMTKGQFMMSQGRRFEGMDPQLLANIWNAFDSDGNGVMDLDEYRLYCAINAAGSRRQRAIALFAVVDTSNDRCLQEGEIMSLMALARKFKKREGMAVSPGAIVELSPEEIGEISIVAKEFMEFHDRDKSGSISVEEFLNGWQDEAFADFNFFDNKQAPLVQA